MQRTITYEPPRSEEIIRTFATTEQLEVFLLRKLEETGKPYLELPYLAYGTTNLEAPPGDRIKRTVLSRPRVYVLPCVGFDGFRLIVEAPEAVGAEEEEPGRWRINERHEPVEAEQFCIWRIEKAVQGRFDGFEELRIQHRGGRIWLIVDETGEPTGERIPCRYDWLRLGLEDPSKHRTEESEDERMALLLLAMD